MWLRPSLCTVFMLLGLGGAAGCFFRSPLPHAYVLAPAGPSGLPAAGRGPAVGVGPVMIPGYLDRTAIVVRAAGDEVRLSEDHRWAESLKDGVARVVAENLAAMIPTDAIVVYPWKTLWVVQYRVTLEIMRFDGPLGGALVLNARWRLLDGAGKELVLRAVSLSEPASDATYGALVSAQSRLLARLSQDIAAEIKSRAL
jgi:uncharacterized lipoprotein YmbA